jgi:hypothetical protein
MKMLRHCLAVTFALTLAAGCASAAGTAPNSAHPRPKAVTKTVTDRDKGTTVTLHVGDRLKVVLASTYWTIHESPKSSVLRTDGGQVTTPESKRCVPGGGCGTASRMFAAVGKGTTTVSASRTTCGEALLCTGGSGKFRVSVVVK